jgi:hypothetical protein
MVELKTSRAAKEPMRPMPICQSKPSGLMAGSMAWPAWPAKLWASCSDLAWRVRGLRVGGEKPEHDGDAEDDGAGAHEEEPCALQHVQDHGFQRGPIRRHFHDHEGGSPFSSVRLKSHAKPNAPPVPSAYMRSMMPTLVQERHAVAGHERGDHEQSRPGRRAEQLISGATRMVTSRSFGFSMVRVAMMPGIAQA